MAELWVPVVGQGTIDGQFKERGSRPWKRKCVNPQSYGATHCRKKKCLSNQEEKLEGVKEWENREVEGSFHKLKLVSKKRHRFKTMIY
jgi:hypothetical protein